MSRRWHLEHADGRRWTKDELDDLTARLSEATRMAPYEYGCSCVFIDPECEPWVKGEYSGLYYVDDPDCVVVWDE